MGMERLTRRYAGTGTGIWYVRYLASYLWNSCLNLRAIQMAKRFSHCHVLGIDLVPTPVEAAKVPDNCQFEIDDITLGLNHHRNRFDLIHARLIGIGLKDFRTSMNDIHQCLKPGGMVIWIDTDYEFFTLDIHVYRTMGSTEYPDGSWSARCLFGECFTDPVIVCQLRYGSLEMTRAGSAVGQSDFVGMEQALDHGFWEDPVFDSET
jgi:SAM-dependent methyltransferase